MKVGFIGLGGMGLEIARNIGRGGNELTVYNRTRSRAEALQADGARVADSPSAAARDAEILITMLADDRAVEDMVFGGAHAGEGAIKSLGKGALHVSMSTISVALSRRMAAAHQEAGQEYISAPVFGRPEAAAAAKLWIVASGNPDQIERCRPIFDVIGQGAFTVGEDAGAANTFKIAGNFVIAAAVESLGEAFALIRKSGLDVEQFLEIISGALFKSPVYQTYGTIIAKERFDPPGFKMKLGLKDVRLALETADATETPMPLAGVIHDHLLSGIARGRGETDWSGFARIIAENAGIK